MGSPDAARGFASANAEFQQKRLEAKQQRFQNMAEMYSNLAKSTADPDLANEFGSRAFQFANADPYDPKSLKTLSKLGDVNQVYEDHYQKKLANPQPQTPPRDEYDVQNFIGPEPNTYDVHGRVTPQHEIYEKERATIEPATTQLRMRQKLIQGALSNLRSRGVDPDSPEGELEQNVALRGAGINEATPTFRPYPTTLPDANGHRQPVLLMYGSRSGKFYMTGPDGKSTEVHPDMPTPQVKVGPDGTVYPIYSGVVGAPTGNVGAQTGTTTSTSTTVNPITNTTTTGRTTGKVFSPGKVGATPIQSQPQTQAVPGMPQVSPMSNMAIPAPISSSISGIHGTSPVTMRASAQMPPQGPTAPVSGPPTSTPTPPIDWERMAVEAPTTDARTVADYVLNPEKWNEAPKNQAAYRTLFQTYNLPVNGPNSKVLTQEGKRARAIRDGIESLQHVRELINSTDGTITGTIAGRWIKAMNEVGSDKGMAATFKNSIFHPDLGSWNDGPNPQTLAKFAQDANPGANPAQVNQLVTRASDLITSLRIFNITELRALSGASQGISRLFQMIAPAMADPKMDPGIMNGHLLALQRNFLDSYKNIYTDVWGPKIPYAPGKEIMGQLRFYPSTEQKIGMLMKEGGLNRNDAVFELWKRGKLSGPEDKVYDTKFGKLPTYTP